MDKDVNATVKESVRIAAVGDIGLIGKVEASIRDQGISYPFASVKPIFDEADIVFGNLEIPISDNSMNHRFSYQSSRMRAATDTVDSLKYAGFDILSLANNHIMDYGREGLELTVRLLKDQGIRPVGAGMDVSHARRPVIIRRKGVRIGFLAYAMRGAHSAGPNLAGAAPLDKDLISEDIVNLRNSVDFLVVSLHFGMMYTDYPSPQDQAVARWIIDCGASLVLGHHPHVIQGIEKYGDGIIAYSLGEFVFDPTTGNVFASFAEEIRKESLMAVVDLAEDAITVDPIPVLVEDGYRPVICKGPRKSAILKRLRHLSEPLEGYSIDFQGHLASRTVGHNLRVLAFHFVRFHWSYILNRLTRIRLRHVRVLLAYLKSLC